MTEKTETTVTVKTLLTPWDAFKFGLLEQAGKTAAFFVVVGCVFLWIKFTSDPEPSTDFIGPMPETECKP